MPNAELARLISEGMRDGMIHPGDPSRDVPARPIAFPVFRSQGQPKEVADLIDATVKQLGEAVVHLIETRGETALVPISEYENLKGLSDEPPGQRTVVVHCHCDAKRADPLIVLSVDNRDHVTVPGQQLIANLSQREAECPHGRKR